ncbi:LOW QUALITY PROTEIN: hypothetical protein HID58_095171 [Brassica napus]|uniref:Uncharacterized protein n=1 Tax=Brassica napus TaxID=3708 RepID=A0ABQ7X4J9_BRANA|nr:LOW QUALITY PROTEIN: hypothetical protein HID58_095171 [Brassica napus]
MSWFWDENVEEDDDDGGNSDNDYDEAEAMTMMMMIDTPRMVAVSHGNASAAFERVRATLLFTEAYPEGEFNPPAMFLRNVLTEEDFLAPLKEHLDIKKQASRLPVCGRILSMLFHAPLPKPQRERLERKAVIGLVDEEFSKWGISSRRIGRHQLFTLTKMSILVSMEDHIKDHNHLPRCGACSSVMSYSKQTNQED